MTHTPIDTDTTVSTTSSTGRTHCPGPRFELWAAGLDDTSSFAICTETRPVWRGAFHPDDWHYRAGDQASADTSAAQKAVFMVGTLRRHLGAESAHLRLHLAHSGVNRRVLDATAAREGIVVELDVDMSGPAVGWCREPGAEHWRAADLTSIAHTDRAVQGRLW